MASNTFIFISHKKVSLFFRINALLECEIDQHDAIDHMIGTKLLIQASILTLAGKNEVEDYICT